MGTHTHRLLIRRSTAASWATRNPVLGEGEPGFEKDTNRLKFGDGFTPWNDLPYFVTDEDGSTLEEHVNSPQPHPAYDDGPDLSLIYENAKV